MARDQPHTQFICSTEYVKCNSHNSLNNQDYPIGGKAHVLVLSSAAGKQFKFVVKSSAVCLKFSSGGASAQVFKVQTDQL